MTYVIDSARFRQAMSERGFQSLEDLVRFAGVHRNTAYHYLSGAPVVSAKLEKLLCALGLEPGECFVSTEPNQEKQLAQVASVIDKLIQERPEFCYVLFGSRASGRARKWSDYDIGIYSHKGVPLKTFLGLMNRKDLLAEDLPVEIQLVNLSHADSGFLQGISACMCFMGGSYGEFLALQERINGLGRQTHSGT